MRKIIKLCGRDGKGKCKGIIGIEGSYGEKEERKRERMKGESVWEKVRIGKDLTSNWSRM